MIDLMITMLAIEERYLIHNRQTKVMFQNNSNQVIVFHATTENVKCFKVTSVMTQALH